MSKIDRARNLENVRRVREFRRSFLAELDAQVAEVIRETGDPDQGGAWFLWRVSAYRGVLQGARDRGAVDEAVSLVFRAYRDRLRACARDPRLAYGQIFKNSGFAAGASLEHAHSQLIGTAVVPTQVKTELSKSRAYWQSTGRCVFCDMLARERQDGRRIVAEWPNFVAFCPFASQFPFETWILPRAHGAKFEEADDEQLEELAKMVRRLVAFTETALNDPAFNYLIHTIPFRATSTACYHWHLEFFPRMTKTAGFEWGAGDYINTVSPEDAASTLRSAFTAP
jgi:UDPglucose--hexose-1-phosphate uridylyltransferase